MIDSGARFHLIDPKDVDDPDGEIKKHIEKTSMIRLRTANGRTSTDEVLPMFVDSLAETLNVLLLPKCPPVISLGTLVERMGYDFHWKHKQKPYLQHPRLHKLIWLDVLDGIPYLPEQSLVNLLVPTTVRETLKGTERAATRAQRRKMWKDNVAGRDILSAESTTAPSSNDDWSGPALF